LDDSEQAARYSAKENNAEAVNEALQLVVKLTKLPLAKK